MGEDYCWFAEKMVPDLVISVSFVVKAFVPQNEMNVHMYCIYTTCIHMYLPATYILSSTKVSQWVGWFYSSSLLNPLAIYLDPYPYCVFVRAVCLPTRNMVYKKSGYVCTYFTFFRTWSCKCINSIIWSTTNTQMFVRLCTKVRDLWLNHSFMTEE